MEMSEEVLCPDKTGQVSVLSQAISIRWGGSASGRHYNLRAQVLRKRLEAIEKTLQSWAEQPEWNSWRENKIIKISMIIKSGYSTVINNNLTILTATATATARTRVGFFFFLINYYEISVPRKHKS
jgi:hypothetical protein